MQSIIELPKWVFGFMNPNFEASDKSDEKFIFRTNNVKTLLKYSYMIDQNSKQMIDPRSPKESTKAEGVPFSPLPIRKPDVPKAPPEKVGEND